MNNDDILKPSGEVVSSNIESFNYKVSKNELTIVFKRRSGIATSYRYEGVPIDIFYDMSKSESVGKFFNEKIKNVYKASKKAAENE